MTNFLNCAVCGESITEGQAIKQEYKEEKSLEKYYFCCQKCRMEFLNEPDKYIGKSGRHQI